MAEGPTVTRRRLALEIKRARERAGMTQERVAAYFEWNAAKVARMENARSNIPPRDVKDLLKIYGNEDEELLESLLKLSRNSKQRTWYTQYRDVLRGDLISLEAEADIVKYWEPNVVPGILQTEDYARALMEAGLPPKERKNLDRHLALRMGRQKRLTDQNPLQVSAVIDQSVIHRVIGDMEAMHPQLERLIELSKLDNVLIQVLPFDAGAHPLHGGPMTIIEFPELSDLDAVYLEGIASDQTIEEPPEVKRYQREFEKLQATALSPEATIKLLRKGVHRP
jgi:transcriptional regulator with XRE-family HTH domain